MLSRSGSGLLVIEGDAGIGKSRLLAELALVAGRQGLVWSDASCDPIAHDRPFGPLLEALGCERTSPDERRRAIGVAVARFGSHGRDDDAGVGSDPWSRYGIQDELVDLILDQVEERPGLIVVDDAQWIDAPTVSALAALIRRRRSRRVGVVLAMRRGDRSPELGALLDRWSGDLEWMSLGPLAPAMAELVAADVLGATPGEELRRNLARAGGNAFSVVQLTSAFASGSDDLNPPSGVRSSVLARVRGLGPDATRLLAVAAILGVDFTPGDLCLLTERDPFDVFDLLYAATQQGLLVERGTRFGFAHDLVGELLAAELPAPLRAMVHRSVVERAADLTLTPSVVAHHVMASASPGDLAAVEALRAAAEEVAIHDAQVALGYLDVAARLCPPGHPQAVTVAMGRAGVLCALRRANDAVAELSACIEAAGTSQEVVRLRMLRARCLHLLGEVEAAAEEFERLALSGVLAPAEEAAAWADVATYRLWAMQGQRPWEEAGRAIALADRSGVVAPAVQAMAAQAAMTAFDGRVDEAIELGRQACRRGDVLPHHVVIPAPSFSLGVAHLVADELGEAIELLGRERLRVEQLGDPFLAVRPATARLIALFLAGRWDETDAEADGIIGVCDDTGSAVGRLTALVLSAMTAHYRGLEEESTRLATMAASLTGAGDAYAVPFLLHLQALHLERDGDRAGGSEVMADICALTGHLVPAIQPWFALDAVRMALDGGTADPVPLVEGLVGRATVTNRPGPQGMALVAAGAAHGDLAVVSDGLALVRRSEQLLNRALAHEVASIVLSAGGDADGAGAAVAEACTSYRELGAVELLNRAGGRIGPRTRVVERRPRFGWSSITPAEIAVLRLLATGARNNEIAEQLVLSRRTVESHVSSMLAKLGLATRVELANEANGRLRP